MYTEEEINLLKDEVINLVSNSPYGLHRLKKLNSHLPAVSTIMLWLKEDEKFSEQYAYAKGLQADLLIDEMLEIADESSNDTLLTEFGEKENKEWVNRSRLRVDTRKWLASKLAPKKYGDKLDITSKDEKIQAPIIIDWGVDNKE